MMLRWTLQILTALIAISALWLAANTRTDTQYARDRAEIDELLSRYTFALDWQEPERYASLFTTDGVLVWAGGTIQGREAIAQEMQKARAADIAANAANPQLRPFRRRHFPTNFALRVEGDKAVVRSLWFETNNDNPERRPYLGAYGHLEDELRREGGEWRIARHQVFNEQREAMAASSVNPAW